MQKSGSIVPIANGIARLVSQDDLQECPAWHKAFQTRCKDHRYYEILERTLHDGFEHYYLLIEDKAGQVRAVQPLFFVRQNLIEGVTGKFRAAVEFVRRTFPRFLTMRVLMVGCAAGEGHLGACASEDEQWVSDALHASLHTIAKQKKASLVVLKDFPASYRPTLRNFSANGYARVPSMPQTRLVLHYADFDEYLKTLGKATRKNLRRKFRKTEGVAPIEMEVVSDISPWVDEIYPLYQQVHDRSPLKFETLTKDYFREVGRRMPEAARFFIWRQEGKIIAFSFCLVHDGTLYDECLGLDYKVALDLHLYFYTLRDIISWSLRQGLKFYCSSPLNYDPKLHLGCDLVPLDLYVRHTVSFLNPIFRQAVKYLEPTRHDPILRQFPNAAELRG
jgi:predicted N-acyltransferase